MKKPELLAPAGDLERLKIALLYGADRGYIRALSGPQGGEGNGNGDLQLQPGCPADPGGGFIGSRYIYRHAQRGGEKYPRHRPAGLRVLLAARMIYRMVSML